MMNNMLKTMMGYLYDPHGIQFATVLNSYHTASFNRVFLLRQQCSIIHGLGAPWVW